MHFHADDHFPVAGGALDQLRCSLLLAHDGRSIAVRGALQERAASARTV
jgi:hypothetical protein